MTKILTQDEIDRIMETWVRLYDMYDVTVDISDVEVPPQPPGYDFPVLNAKEMHADDVNTVFQKRLSGYGVVVATAPVQIGDGKGGWKTLSFTDLTSPNDRTTDQGSYVFWVKKHFKVKRDYTFKRKEFDSRMTAEEAMLYHLYWFWKYNNRYLGHHYADFHFCDGSKGCKGLRWDLQDIKVCLD